jgi:hypothetical protein
MTRTFSTITWGLALLAAAVVLAWSQSLPWALAAAGGVAVLGGLVRALPVWLARDTPVSVRA